MNYAIVSTIYMILKILIANRFSRLTARDDTQRELESALQELSDAIEDHYNQ